MTETYVNAYEVEYLFEEMPNGDIKWTGPFAGCRKKESNGRINMVNPKGGPQLKRGRCLAMSFAETSTYSSITLSA